MTKGKFLRHHPNPHLDFLIKMTEKQFQNRVKKFLKDQDCWVLKTFSSGVQRSGIPDLLICCNGYFIGAELKAAKGKPSELQEWNIEQIKKAGGIGLILYPKDFEDFKKLVVELKGR